MFQLLLVRVDQVELRVILVELLHLVLIFKQLVERVEMVLQVVVLEV